MRVREIWRYPVKTMAGEKLEKAFLGPLGIEGDRVVQDTEITQSIYERFEGKLALNCFVIEGGEITVGDEVQLVRDRTCSEAVFAG